MPAPRLLRRVYRRRPVEPNSQEPTVADVRAAMRVVGDCRDVGGDPAAWNLRVACFFKERLRSVLTTCFTLSMDGSTPTAEEILCTLWVDNRLHARWLKFIAKHGYRRYPSVQRFSERYRGAPLVVRRQDLLPNPEWRASPERIDRRSVGQDELLYSAHPAARGLSHVFSLNRALGDRPFTARDRNLVRLVHEELGRLFSLRLSLRKETQALPADLSVRSQAVLICLLSGDSDKQIATRLGLSKHTIHEYVTALFRRFEVHSRAELFALATRNRWMPNVASLPPK